MSDDSDRARSVEAIQHHVILPLRWNAFKGDYGIVGVVGGSLDYTGAPYYAASASLKAGADLAFVFCAPAAAAPLKSYSPELMVSPVLRDSGSVAVGAAAEYEAGLSAARLNRTHLRRVTALVVG